MHFKRDTVTYSKLSRFCFTLQNIGLAPYGLCVVYYEVYRYKRNALNWCFQFGEKEDFI